MWRKGQLRGRAGPGTAGGRRNGPLSRRISAEANESQVSWSPGFLHSVGSSSEGPLDSLTPCSVAGVPQPALTDQDLPSLCQHLSFNLWPLLLGVHSETGPAPHSSSFSLCSPGWKTSPYCSTLTGCTLSWGRGRLVCSPLSVQEAACEALTLGQEEVS